MIIDWINTNIKFFDALGSIGTFFTFFIMYKLLNIERNKDKFDKKNHIFIPLFHETSSLVKNISSFKPYHISLLSVQSKDIPDSIVKEVKGVNRRLRSYCDELDRARMLIQNKISIYFFYFKLENTCNKGISSSPKDVERIKQLSEKFGDILIELLLDENNNRNINNTWIRINHKKLYEEILDCGITEGQLEETLCELSNLKFDKITKEQKELHNCLIYLKKKLEKLIPNFVNVDR